MTQASKSLLKICATCGRQITWRKKWEKNWSSIIYCSDSCRKHKIKLGSLDCRFETAILSLLTRRKADQLEGKTAGLVRLLTCEDIEAHVLTERENLSKLSAGTEWQDPSSDPSFQESFTPPNKSEAPEEAFDMREGQSQSDLKQDPKRVRERCRQAARRLAARGEIVILQNGKIVDPSFAKGVLELSLP